MCRYALLCSSPNLWLMSSASSVQPNSHYDKRIMFCIGTCYNLAALYSFGCITYCSFSLISAKTCLVFHTVLLCPPDQPMLKSILKWRLRGLQLPRSATWILHLEVWVHHWLAFVTWETHATWTQSCSVCVTLLQWLITSTKTTTWRTLTGQDPKSEITYHKSCIKRKFKMSFSILFLCQVEHPWP